MGPMKLKLHVCCKIKMDRGGCGHFFEQIKQSIRVLVDTQLDS